MAGKTVRIGRETAALIERFRDSLFQSDEEVIQAALTRLAEKNPKTPAEPTTVAGSDTVGCDLGQGAVLAEGEAIYLFRYRTSKESGRFEGVATARGGKLFMGDVEVMPSRGSLVQPALQMVQRRLNDVSPSRGGFVVLDAWDYWYVRRQGRYVRVGDLRDPGLIQRRRKRRNPKDRALFRQLAE
jgi:hypothetical protein